jgi:intron-binding protein aquarius
MLLQKAEDGHSRLKRVVLIGDHHQLPPVVKNMAFQKYCNMDQSLFTRFVRLGTPYIELNAQGRARPQLSSLYSWRYRSLGDLPSTNQGAYTLANPGFAHELQFVDVGDYDGVGETEPTPHFLQNLGEAEYLVSVFQYMRLLGYPANKISIITTYRGQKHLIRDVIARRCAAHPLFGTPKHVTTVDKFQGQQNDYVLLSLVRTRAVGHLRDVRRLVVAMSRARLGLYVFGRQELFEQCYELAPSFKQLLKFPTKLAVVPTESYPPALDGGGRGVADKVTPYLVADALAMGTVVNQLALKWQQEQMVAARGAMQQFAPVAPAESMAPKPSKPSLTPPPPVFAAVAAASGGEGVDVDMDEAGEGN